MGTFGVAPPGAEIVLYEESRLAELYSMPIVHRRLEQEKPVVLGLITGKSMTAEFPPIRPFIRAAGHARVWWTPGQWETY